MSQRIAYNAVAPDGMKILGDMDEYTKQRSICRNIRELVMIRVSQINGCAISIDSHSSEARKKGETEQRIYCLNAWQKCSFYTAEERLALELAEHITCIADKGVPDELYQRVREYFNEQEYTDLVLIINYINSINRLAISMGEEPKER